MVLNEYRLFVNLFITRYGVRLHAFHVQHICIIIFFIYCAFLLFFFFFFFTYTLCVPVYLNLVFTGIPSLRLYSGKIKMDENVIIHWQFLKIVRKFTSPGFFSCLYYNAYIIAPSWCSWSVETKIFRRRIFVYHQKHYPSNKNLTIINNV